MLEHTYIYRIMLLIFVSCKKRCLVITCSSIVHYHVLTYKNWAKVTINQVTTMLTTSKISYFHAITTCQPPVLMTRHCASDDDNSSEGSSAKVLSKWLRPGRSTFLEAASMAVTLWIVDFLRIPTTPYPCINCSRHVTCYFVRRVLHTQ